MSQIGICAYCKPGLFSVLMAEVEFVHAITAGSSVKFLPAV